MTAPDGWQEWDPCVIDANRPVECGNCDWTGRELDVELYIPDLQDRVDPGMTMPVGVCPCGSLVYFSDVEIVYRRKPGVLGKIVEATSG